jgi:hypothetical protein
VDERINFKLVVMEEREFEVIQENLRMFGKTVAPWEATTWSDENNEWSLRLFYSRKISDPDSVPFSYPNVSKYTKR